MSQRANQYLVLTALLLSVLAVAWSFLFVPIQECFLWFPDNVLGLFGSLECIQSAFRE